MSDLERLRVLRATRELGGLSSRELARLLPYFDEQAVPAGSQLALEGRLCHEFVVVAAGFLETCRGGRPGVLSWGGSFGWVAMRDRGVHDATVVAASRARLLVMGHEQFRAAEALAG